MWEILMKQSSKPLIAFVVMSAAILTGCNPSQSPQSNSSQASFQACMDLVTSVPGLELWIQNVQVLLPANDFVAAKSESERITAYRLLKANEQFSSQGLAAEASLSSKILPLTPDIRQQGPGCVNYFDALFTLNRALPVVAGRMLTCALRAKVITYALMCPNEDSVAKGVKRLTEQPLAVLSETFGPPTLEYLQSLRPWDGSTSEESILQSFSTMGKSYACFSWTGAFGLDAKKFAAYLELTAWAAWEESPPVDPISNMQLIRDELPILTSELYGSPEEFELAVKQAYETLKNMTTATTTAVRAAPVGTEIAQALAPLNLEALCGDVAAQVDILGGPQDTQTIAEPNSSNSLLGSFYEGVTECQSGKLGSDYTKCLLTRVFIPVASILDEQENLEIALASLSYFELPIE